MNAPALPWLSDTEVQDLCAGLTQPAAQCKYIERELKLPVRRKPNGRPLVLRSSVESLGAPPQAQASRSTEPARRRPNAASLELAFSRK